MPSRNQPSGTQIQSKTTESEVDEVVTTQSVASKFEKNYCQYQLALSRIQADENRRRAEAQDRFSRQIQKAQVEAYLLTQEAYHAYLTAHQKSQTNPDKTSLADVHQAYREYANAFQVSQEAVERACAEADRTNQQETGRAQEEIAAKWEAAFQDYVRATQKIWSEVETQNVTAATIAMIGGTMIAASTSASSAEQVRFSVS